MSVRIVCAACGLFLTAMVESLLGKYDPARAPASHVLFVPLMIYCLSLVCVRQAS